MSDTVETPGVIDATAAAARRAIAALRAAHGPLVFVQSAGLHFVIRSPRDQG